MAYFRCQQGSSSGGAGATITVTYNSSFYNKTMTCTNGTKTYTKTTTSSGSTTFNVNEEGTWTITCNGVSRTVNVVLSYTTQMAITKNITIYGAKEDYITYTDATGSKVCQFASGKTSKSVSITFIPPSAKITFTSSVSKNPNNLSNNYSKVITITKNTTAIYIMPNGALYWWGYEDNDLEDCTSTNGWSAGVTMVNPTHNTQNIALTTRTSQISAVGINNGSLSARNIKSIIKGKTISGSQYGTIQISSSKNLAQVTNYTLVDSNALKLYTIAYTSGYVAIEADSNRACEIYALWYE